MQLKLELAPQMHNLQSTDIKPQSFELLAISKINNQIANSHTCWLESCDESPCTKDCDASNKGSVTFEVFVLSSSSSGEKQSMSSTSCIIHTNSSYLLCIGYHKVVFIKQIERALQSPTRSIEPQQSADCITRTQWCKHDRTY